MDDTTVRTSTPTSRAWAMRTSRDTQAHRDFIATELRNGRLRQGWGYHADQDLRSVQARIKDPAVHWSGLTDQEKEAWGHWRMLGEHAGSQDGMRIGDVVLVPNLPNDGLFVLCRLTGPYRYKIDPGLKDFGHIRDVEILTPSAVSFKHPLVQAQLRRSLGCRSRLWWIGSYGDNLTTLLAAAASGAGQSLSLGSNHADRARNRVASEILDSFDQLAGAIEAPLRQTLQSAEWEGVLRDALVPLMQRVEVRHTGGPSEKGADLEIHVPNPFRPKESWVIAVQVKDFDGEVGIDVAGQLEEAIIARQGLDEPGSSHLVAVVLASTRASPSAGLLQEIKKLSSKYHLPVSCVHGKDLMKVIARGMLMGHRDQ